MTAFRAPVIAIEPACGIQDAESYPAGGSRPPIRIGLTDRASPVLSSVSTRAAHIVGSLSPRAAISPPLEPVPRRRRPSLERGPDRQSSGDIMNAILAMGISGEIETAAPTIPDRKSVTRAAKEHPAVHPPTAAGVSRRAIIDDHAIKLLLRRAATSAASVVDLPQSSKKTTLFEFRQT